MSVGFATTGADRGSVLRLALHFQEAVDGEESGCRVLCDDSPPVDEGFQAAVEAAAGWAARQERFPSAGRVLWSVRALPGEELPSQLKGGSVGAAAAVGLAFLLGLTTAGRWRHLDRTVVLSGSVDSIGRIGNVDGLERKAVAAAAADARFVVPEQGREQALAAHVNGRPAVTPVGQVHEAVRASALPRSRRALAAMAAALLATALLPWAVQQWSADRAAQRHRQVDYWTDSSRALLGQSPGQAALAALRAHRADPADPDVDPALMRADYADTRLSGVVDVQGPQVATAYDPAGRTLVIADGGLVTRYDATTRHVLGAIGRVAGQITGLWFTPDGRALLMATARGTVLASTQRAAGDWSSPRRLAGGVGPVQALAVSADSRHIAWSTAADGIRVRTLDDPASTFTLRSADPYVTSLAFLPGGRLAVGLLPPAGSGSSSLEVLPAWGRSLAQVLLLNPTSKGWFTRNGVTALAVVDDGRELISGGIDNKIRLWNGMTLHADAVDSAPGAVDALQTTADGSTAIVATRTFPAFVQPDIADADASVQALDLTHGAAPLGPAYGADWATLTGQFAVNPVAGSVAVTMARVGSTTPVTLWLPPRRASPHGTIYNVVTDPVNPDAVLALYQDGTLVRFHSDGRSTPLTRFPEPTWSMDLSADGRTLAIGGDGGRITLYHFPALTVAGQFGSGRDPVRGVAFSLDGTSLASLDAAGVHLWDLATHTLRSTPRTGAPALPLTLAWSSDSSRVLVTYRNGDAYVADSHTGEVIAQRSFGSLMAEAGGVGGISASAPYRDGFLVGFADGTLALYSAGLELTGTLPSGEQNTVVLVGLSPDNATLAATSADGTALISAPGTGIQLGTLKNDNTAPGSAQSMTNIFFAEAFTRDGRYLVLGDAAGTLTAVAVTDSSLVQRACSLIDPTAAPSWLKETCR